MASPRDIETPDGRVLRVHDSGGPPDALCLVWHTGSPQTGVLLDPLLAATAARGMRLLSYARPSYRGSTPRRGRDVAAAAGDVARIADDAGIERFAVMGASGGGPHALACAALLPERVLGAVSLAGLAPFTESFDWYAGMADDRALRAAAAGRAARERFAATAEFSEDTFTAADWAALDGEWASLGADAGRAHADGPEGLIDDDLAFAAPWGFDVGDVRPPVLIIHGGEDRMIPPSHAHWLLAHLPAGELWLRPRAGHISILDACPVAMDWLRALPSA